MKRLTTLWIGGWITLLAGCGQADIATRAGGNTATPAGFVEAGPLRVVPTVQRHVFIKDGTSITVDLDHLYYEDDIELKVGDEVRVIHHGTRPEYTYRVRLDPRVVARHDGGITDPKHDQRELYPQNGWHFTTHAPGTAYISILFFGPPRVVCHECPAEYYEEYNFQLNVQP